MLDRDSITCFLNELAADLDARGVRGEMFIVGGAVMALAYGSP